MGWLILLLIVLILALRFVLWKLKIRIIAKEFARAEKRNRKH